jgi:hypothetical protein
MNYVNTISISNFQHTLKPFKVHKNWSIMYFIGLGLKEGNIRMINNFLSQIHMNK